MNHFLAYLSHEARTARLYWQFQLWNLGYHGMLLLVRIAKLINQDMAQGVLEDAGKWLDVGHRLKDRYCAAANEYMEWARKNAR